MPVDFWPFLLIFARVTALFVTAPVLGSRSVPARVKVGLAALVTFALMPLVAGQIPPVPADILALIGQVTAETALGLCLGFMTALLFAAIQMAGAFVDTQMGFGIINVLNPMSEQQSSAMGQFLHQLSLTLFLLLGGHLYLVGTLAGSYALIGPGAAHFTGDLPDVLTGLVGQIFILAFKIAAPAAAVLLVVDVAFAIIARTVPQMNVFIVGFPVKIIVGLVTVALVLPMLAVAVSQMLPITGDGAASFLRAAR